MVTSPSDPSRIAPFFGLNCQIFAGFSLALDVVVERHPSSTLGWQGDGEAGDPRLAGTLLAARPNLNVASDERPYCHVVESLDLEHIGAAGRRRSRLSTVVDVNREAYLLGSCSLRLIGLTLELGVFAGRTDGARADHERLERDCLDPDVGLMVVVFEISFWITAGKGEAERRLAADARRVGTLLNEHRCEFKN